MAKFNDTFSNKRIADLHRQEEERYMQALAPQYGYEYIDLNGIAINPEALLLVPEAKARQAELAVFDKTQKVLSAAIHTPQSAATQTLIHDLESQGYQLRIYMVSSSSLEHAFERYKENKQSTATKRGVLDISTDDIINLARTIKQPEQVRAGIMNIRTINGPRRISETLEMIFAGALALKASDIHIEPEASGIRMRYRIDGVLLDIIDLEQHIYGRIMSRLKLLSGMILNQRKEAQDGRFTFTFADREIEIRSSNIPGSFGESMVMRLLDPSVASFSMEHLNLNPLLKEVMLEQLKRPNGLIITTGPTGSGKTTALYAFLKEVHQAEKKIITIENPVEYKLDGIVQTQIGDDYTFSAGLRAILRQDPDIIMVGEIRDREVAETAMHAAQTGHLVFSTLHTNSAVGGFPRLIDLGVDPHTITSSVNLILGQRLVRVLCTHCKQAVPATAEERQLITTIAADYPGGLIVPDPLTLYKPAGCAVCNNTGYKGRIAVFEGILINDAVEEVIIRDPREHVILEAAKTQHIPTMQHDGIAKVIAGDTDLAELERVVDLSQDTGATIAPATPATDEVDFVNHIVT